MTLKDARQLRDYIGSKTDLNCTVPVGGGRGPDGYFATSHLREGRHEWQSRAEFRKWFAGRLWERRRINRRYEQAIAPRRDTRSPIERMIDQACGLP